MCREALVNRSAVVEAAYLSYILEDIAMNESTRWYRSKEMKGGEHPFASYMLNKKWTLEEEFNNHMMRFNQVTVSSSYFSKIHIDFPGWADSP